MARNYLGLDPRAEDWRCDDLVCSHNLGQGARGVFVFRRDDDGQPKLWIVGDDVDPSIQPEATSTLPEAIKGAKRQECPDRAAKASGLGVLEEGVVSPKQQEVVPQPPPASGSSAVAAGRRESARASRARIPAALGALGRPGRTRT